jgi:hypothetical protein
VFSLIVFEKYASYNVPKKIKNNVLNLSDKVKTLDLQEAACL